MNKIYIGAGIAVLVVLGIISYFQGWIPGTVSQCPIDAGTGQRNCQLLQCPIDAGTGIRVCQQPVIIRQQAVQQTLPEPGGDIVGVVGIGENTGESYPVEQ